MTYWSAKSDLAFMESFRDDVHLLWAREDAHAGGEPIPAGLLSDIDAPYRDTRKRISEHLNRVRAIAYRHDVGHDFTIILRQRGAGVQRQSIEDGLNRAIGALKDEVATERRRVWNPLWWLLYGPFVLLRSAGVDTSTIERRFWSRVFVQLLFGVIIGTIATILATLLLRAAGITG